MRAPDNAKPNQVTTYQKIQALSVEQHLAARFRVGELGRRNLDHNELLQMTEAPDVIGTLGGTSSAPEMSSTATMALVPEGNSSM